MLSWDSHSLDVSESGLRVLELKALDVVELQDVLGEEVILVSEDGVILGWNVLSVMGNKGSSQARMKHW